MYYYKAQIIDWKDGDTVEIRVFVGFRIEAIKSVRVLGINTPEIVGQEKVFGERARNRAMELAPPGSFVEIQSHKDGDGDKYGRWLAEIKLRDGRDYATVMLQESLAKPWDGTGSKPA